MKTTDLKDNISPNFIDRFVSFFNPEAGARRLRARFSIGVAKRALSKDYESATTGRRTKNWRPTGSDSEKSVLGSLAMLRARSRDLVRNNPFANKAINTIVANTIGYGIEMKSQTTKSQNAWREWSEGMDCDDQGRLTFNGIQEVALRSVVESGEVLIKRVRTSSSSGNAIPLKLQILEGDFIDVSKTESLGSAKNTRDGIEYNDNNKITAYWLYRKHPGAKDSYTNFKDSSVRVPAEDIIHLYRMDRVGQVRGVPWGAPSLLRLRDLDEYEDTQLIRQKIAACFTGFIKTSEQPMNATTNSADEQKPISERFSPGAWEVLGPGQDIVLATPPGVGTDYDPYNRRNLIAISAGFGVPYECLTGDLSNVNFSSGRMGWLEFQRNIDLWRWNMFMPRFLDVVWEWWLDAAVLAGAVDPSRIKKPQWTPPKREMIDPVKETAAAKSAVRSGFMTLSEALREQGYDPKEQMQEYAKDLKLLDDLGIIVDTDVRKVNGSGAAQGSSDSNAPEQKEEEDG